MLAFTTIHAAMQEEGSRFDPAEGDRWALREWDKGQRGGKLFQTHFESLLFEIVTHQLGADDDFVSESAKRNWPPSEYTGTLAVMYKRANIEFNKGLLWQPPPRPHSAYAPAVALPFDDLDSGYDSDGNDDIGNVDELFAFDGLGEEVEEAPAVEQPIFEKLPKTKAKKEKPKEKPKKPEPPPPPKPFVRKELEKPPEPPPKKAPSPPPKPKPKPKQVIEQLPVMEMPRTPTPEEPTPRTPTPEVVEEVPAPAPSAIEVVTVDVEALEADLNLPFTQWEVEEEETDLPPREAQVPSPVPSSSSGISWDDLPGLLLRRIHILWRRYIAAFGQNGARRRARNIEGWSCRLCLMGRYRMTWPAASMRRLGGSASHWTCRCASNVLIMCRQSRGARR